MIFRTPELKEVFESITDNNELVNNLNENDYLLNKKNIYETYEKALADQMLPTIYTSNKEMMYNLAEILYNNSEYIKTTSIDIIIDNKFKFDEIASIFGQTSLKEYTYKLIFYSYKYCYTSSFFQNNVNNFIPEYDYTQIKNSDITNAFTDALMKEFDKIDYTISKCAEFMDFDKIPFDYISYLSQLLGFDKKDIYTSNEEQYRELCKCMIDIYRIKGTNYSFQLLFNFLGFNVSIYEYYFDRRFYFSKDGNTETSEYDKTKKEYYLTTTNPVMNNNSSFTRSEVVTNADVSTQYSLIEFEYLIKTYGPECVLGYSNYYTKKNKKIEYTGKIYKYFKTNYVYYNIGLTNGKNPTGEQISAINKYLEFLTPAFIMKNLTIDLYTGNEDEVIKFDGDGKKDENGNPIHEPEKFEILDSEDWDTSNKYAYTTFKNGTEGYFSPFANEEKIANFINNYNNGQITKEERTSSLKKYGFIQYKNSLGEAYFRQPLVNADFYYNTNRFLGNGDNARTPIFRRIYSYRIITEDENGKEKIEYHYSEPTKESSFNQKPNTVYTDNENTDLNGSSNSIKEKIKQANTGKEIDFYISPANTYKTVKDLTDSNIFTDLVYTKTSNANFIKVRTITRRKSISNNYVLYEIYNQYKDYYNFINIKEADSYKNYRFTKDEVVSLLNSFYEDSSKEYYNEAKELIKHVYYGCYILTYIESSTNIIVNIYKYETIPEYIYKDSDGMTVNDNVYNQCEWTIVKFDAASGNENGEISSSDSDYIIDSSYQTFISLKKAVDNANSKNKKSSFNTRTLYYIRGEKSYYRLIKNSIADINCTTTISYSFDKAKNSDNKIICINPYIKNLFVYNDTEGYKLTSDTVYDLTKTYFSYMPYDITDNNGANRYEKFVVNPKAEELYEISNKSYVISSDTVYDSSKTYYYVKAASDSGVVNKVFNTIEDAEAYFSKNPYAKRAGTRFFCNGYSIDSSTKFSLMNGLYTFVYKNVKPGMLIYSEADDETRGKLYEITGITSDSIKEINFDGNIKVSDNTAEIYDYDKSWGGYDEYADRDDFIMYNNYHSMDYYGFYGKYYKRPTKYYCDYLFNNNGLAQTIIKDIVSQTADRMNDYELYGWDKTNVVGKGIISKIEDIIEFEDNALLDYYSNASSFFVDYYNFVICKKDGYFDSSSIKGTLSDEQLRAKFNCALYNLKIIKDFVSTKTYRINYAYYNSNMLKDYQGLESGYNSSSHTYKKLDGVNSNTVSINSSVLKYMKNELFAIARKTGQIVKFSKDGTNVKYDATQDKYDETTKTYYVSSSYMPEFDYCDLSKWNIGVSDTIFTLKYNLEFIDDGSHYSQDYYGNYYDIYDNLINLYDIFIGGAKPEDSSKEISTSSEAVNFKFSSDSPSIEQRKIIIDDFLKNYYYTEILKRYREKFIDENDPDVVIKNDGSDTIYPKLIERLNGKAGKLSLGRTLLTSTISNGKTDEIIKIPFLSYNISKGTYDNNYVVTLYTRKKDFSSRTGITLNKGLAELTMYYATMSNALKNTETAAIDAKAIKESIEKAYSKIVTMINPKFFFDKNTEKPSESKISISFLNSGATKNIEKEHDDISVGILPSNTVISSILKNTSEAERVKEFASLVNEKNQIPFLKKVVDTSKYYSFSFNIEVNNLNSSIINTLTGTEDEIISKLDNISKYAGYFEMHNLKPELIDNYISIPQSRDWIDVNGNNRKDEFISFGDDRDINIKVSNDYFLSDKNGSIDESKFDNYTNIIESAAADTENLSGLKAVLSIQNNDKKISEYDYQTRKAVQNQNIYDEVKEGNIIYNEKQEYLESKEKKIYKKNYINKIIKNLNEIILETNNVDLANISDITLICYIIFTSFKAKTIYEKLSVKYNIKQGLYTNGRSVFEFFKISNDLLNIIKNILINTHEDIYILRGTFCSLKNFLNKYIKENIKINYTHSFNKKIRRDMFIFNVINKKFFKLLNFYTKNISEKLNIKKSVNTGKTFNIYDSILYKINLSAYTGKIFTRIIDYKCSISEPLKSIIFIITSKEIDIYYKVSSLLSIIISFGEINQSVKYNIEKTISLKESLISGIYNVNYSIIKELNNGLSQGKIIDNSFSISKVTLSIR